MKLTCNNPVTARHLAQLAKLFLHCSSLGTALSRLTKNFRHAVTSMLQPCLHPVMDIPATARELSQLATLFLHWHAINSVGTGFMHHSPVTTC